MSLLSLVQKNICLVGGEVLIPNLTDEEATAILAVAKEKGLAEVRFTESLDAWNLTRLKFEVDPNRDTTLYIGHTVNCENPLLEALKEQENS